MSFHLRLFATLTLALPLAAHADKPRKVPPPLPAAQYPAHDTHEQITIAADPGDTKDTAPRTRIDYLSHGFVPIRIIVTNDSSQPLSLDEARILLVPANSCRRERGLAGRARARDLLRRKRGKEDSAARAAAPDHPSRQARR